jgi:serine/threonine protein kinase
MEKYKKIRQIGAGGFCVLYEVQSSENKKFALKELIDNSEENKRRFKREISLVSRIRHENIISIISENTDSEPYSFTMPLASGNLREYLRAHRENSHIELFYEILHGLKVAHDNGIIHRDLKPENILLFEKENNRYQVVISDFGLGVLINRETTILTSSFVSLGTPFYCSPEQIRNARDVDKLTDIYSLGVILYDIFSNEDIPTMDFDKIPEKYHHIIKKCTYPNKSLRYQSVDEIITDLDFIQEASFEKPSDILEGTQKRTFDGRPLTQENVKQILDTYINSIGISEIFRVYLPVTYDPILESMINSFPSEFETVFKAYDTILDEGVSFDYSDVVATFYKKVFSFSKSIEIKSIIIQRLPVLGRNNNRFYVGEVFADILSELTDPGLINEVYTLFKNDPSVANFCKEYFCKKSVPKVFREFCND